MPELAGPQPVESREAYDKAVAEYNEAQKIGANLPQVAYDQPGQVIAPEQLPDPRINILAGFAPQDISSVVVAPSSEVLAHPAGLELNDPLRTHGGDAYKLASKFAAENAESYDEQKRLNELSAPERDQLDSKDKSDSKPSEAKSDVKADQSADKQQVRSKS